LIYVSIDGLYRAIADARRENDNPQYCDACFTGDYPIRLVDKQGGEAPLFNALK
jgi:amidophosphoribosyltransferase